jgi:hypothetical protein
MRHNANSEPSIPIRIPFKPEVNAASRDPRVT